jgi:hypothetical protein
MHFYIKATHGAKAGNRKYKIHLQIYILKKEVELCADHLNVAFVSSKWVPPHKLNKADAKK